MKSILVSISTLVLGLSLPLFAAKSATDPLIGEYEYAHQIFMRVYDESDCLSEKGEWFPGEGCLLNTSDSIAVSRQKGKYWVEISTIASSAHTCDFQGEATLVASNHLKTSYTFSESGKKVLCEISVVFDYEGTYALSIAKDECKALCGLNASLNVEKAYKK